jgi:hypothetical protein
MPQRVEPDTRYPGGICLIVRDREPTRYERAAVRRLGRFALEAHATLADLKRAAEALDSLPEDANTAMEELATLCQRYELPGCRVNDSGLGPPLGSRLPTIRAGSVAALVNLDEITKKSRFRAQPLVCVGARSDAADHESTKNPCK